MRTTEDRDLKKIIHKKFARKLNFLVLPKCQVRRVAEALHSTTRLPDRRGVTHPKLSSR